MKSKSLMTSLMLVVSLVGSIALADRYDDRGRGRGPGYGDDRRDDRYDRDDRWGRDRDDRYRPRPPGHRPPPPPPHRPPPPPPPPVYADLCSGRYVGYYSNGVQAVIDFQRSYGDSINVVVKLNSYPNPVSGNGYCRQYGNTAQWEFSTLGVLNRGTIRDGYMTGGQPGGASLNASKQW